ncbi:hypothetical protein [Nocardiopsis sp. CNT312]|uniref:hypothetical protein n=1 Tax=Nocardiopsis sp. CNT312 TaxID=1137268 RepID=UPI00048DA4BE|nr:hypothetical protein [Nocardiopsis sp. CNT312]
MGITKPGDGERWRCAGCGNLTRFDVTRAVRSRDYVHQDLAGHGVVEEQAVLTETVERVACRWCGATDSMEVVARPGAGAPDSGGAAESTTGRS